MSGTFNGRIAYASVSPIGGPIGAEFTNQSGDFASVSSANPGEFDLVLSSPIDPSEAIYVATTTEKDGEIVQVWRAACTDTLVKVLTFSAPAVPASRQFDLAIIVKPLV